MGDERCSRLAEAVDFALCHGLVKLDADQRVVHAPFTLNPFALAKRDAAVMAALTPGFHRVTSAVAAADNFLRDELTSASRADPFLARLLQIGARPRTSQPLTLAVTRSDYFLVERGVDGVRPIQVELNTIAASYPALSGLTHRLHRHLHDEGAGLDALVDNDPVHGIAAGMAEAARRHGSRDGVLVMVVQPGERNRFDQRLLEFRLRELGVATRRVSLDEIGGTGSLREGHLVVHGEIAAVTYFRAGYGPEDYAHPDAWRARELIESSDTVAVPNAAWQLAGSKKIQQALARGGVLEGFCGPEDAAALSSTFAGLYDLEQPVPQAEGALPAWRAAIEFPGRFVLKPQREGGGNNLFDGEMRAWLERSTRAERDAYILMDRLRPASHRALLVSEGAVRDTEAVSEIGRYGVFLAEPGREWINADTGYLVRTKPAESREGGVSAGFGFLSSLTLRGES